VKLLIDMNLSPRWIAFLAGEDVSAVHWSQVAEATASDEEIMRFAARDDCVVLTHDLDFGAMLAATQGRKPSVVQIRSGDVRPSVIGHRVIAALQELQAELQSGALLTIDLDRTRIRLLPLRND
jgi:predicted nuclease of predicted toxin-antitoxin system